MVLALVSAFYIRVLVSRPARWLRGVVVPMVCILAVVALTFWQSGYLLVSGGDMQSGGLGHYSMNLLAPVMAMGTSRWFRATALERVATAGQYEGYAYLGAGLLVVTCIALAVGIVRITRRGVNVEWRSVVPLLLVCLVLTLLALSPTITAGTVTVLQYRESLWGPLSVFRSSGRLFWPVFYCALFIAVAIVARGLRPWIAASLLVAAIILQIADLAAYYQRVARSRQAEWLTPLQNTFWKSATPHYRHVTLVPTALCANPADAVDYRPFALLASDVGITINSGFAARLDLPRMREYCRAFARDRARGVIAHDELYIVSPAALPEFVRRATTPIVCPMLDGYAVCFSRESYVQWQDTYDLTLSLVPRMPDLLWFRDALEAKYRDDLQRSPSPAQGSMADRVAWIAKFVSYRYTSCTSDDAFNKVLRELGGTREARLCPDFRPGRGEMPAAAETVRLLEAVERFFQSNRQTQVGMTSVDPEGEAAWMTAYISARLDGRRREEARDQIFGKIDAVRR
jgi:hypothetical protein